MILNYLRLALRNMGRKKLYTIINLTGLGAASAFCILVYWYVQHEYSFDRFHKNGEQLYRLEFSQIFDYREKPKANFFSFLMKDAEEKRLIQTPTILAGELQKSFPEIENAVRIQPGYQIVVRVNNQSFKEENNSAFVDPSFFKVFNFPLKEGNAATVLAGRNGIVISEKIAEKYFGRRDPIGKILLLPNMNNLAYTVAGITKDFPQNSSFRFDFLMPRESVPDYEEAVKRGFNTYSDLLILQLKAGTNPLIFQHKLDVFGRKLFGPSLKEWANFPGSEMQPENFHLFLRPYAESHYNTSGGWGHYTDLKNIYQLGCLAIVILLIACLNYILLTLTATVSRSQEVGIRKAVGAGRKQIILQFYIETQLLAFCAVIVGLILAVICLPLFSRLIGTDLKFSFFPFKQVAVLLFQLAVILGVTAGTYPALVMSGLKALNMLRNFSAYRLNPFLSRILVVTQFTVCIILIISALAISQQMRYMNDAELGFDTDQIVTIQSPYDFDNMENAFQLKDRFYQYAASEPAIADITTSNFPFEGYNNTSNVIINGEKTMVISDNVDYNYFSFYGIPVIQGRSFNPAIQADSAEIKINDAQLIPGSSAARQAVVVNETLYNLLGHPVLNEFNRELGGTIIGVCKDYHADNLTKKIAPAYHRIERKFIWNFSIKIKAGQNIPVIMDKIKKGWSVLTDHAPFSYAFLDEAVARSYEAYLRWMQTVTASCLLAIIIACLGLFGLSGLITINRTKEMGIRKVMGATLSDLFLLLNRNTFIMTLLSFVIAVPVALYLVHAWLQNFAYHIQPGWPLFLLAGLVSLLTALLAVSYHTVKTAKTNPVKSLRSE